MICGITQQIALSMNIGIGLQCYESWFFAEVGASVRFMRGPPTSNSPAEGELPKGSGHPAWWERRKGYGCK